MKPGWKHYSSTCKKKFNAHKLSYKGGIKKSHSGKHKHHDALKRYYEAENTRLVARVPDNSYSQKRRPPKRRFFTPTDQELSSEESSSEDSSDGAIWRTTENERSVDDDDDDDESHSDIGDESEVEEDKISIVMSQETGFFVIVVDHPMAFTINGTVSIRVISGTVNVLGYELDAKKDFVSIYSASDIFHMCVETTSSTQKSYCHLIELEDELKKIANAEQFLLINELIKETSVVMILKKNENANFLEFAQSYIPSTLPLCASAIPNSEKMVHLGCTISGVSNFSVRPSQALYDTAEVMKFDVFSFIKNCSTTRTPRIMVYGQRGLGKSTSLRFLINNLLSSGVTKKIFYLDVDPGQSEFTLPGCISLTEIQEPLFGPSYTHLQSPKKCKFFGHLTVDVARKYFHCLQDVMDYYITTFPNDILFINTFGWIKELGLEALEAVRKTLKPTIEIELIRSDKCEPFEFVCNANRTDYPRKCRIPSNVEKSTTSIIPATRRSISILSYFGKLTSILRPYKSFESFKPFCISVTDFAIHIINGELWEFERLLNTINSSVVALCIVDDCELIHSIDDTQSKRLLPGSHFGDCIGFGYVRAINFAKKLLYILTPVEWNKLRKVNALIKGDLTMPDESFVMQSFLKEIPYATAPVQKAMGKKVRRRTYREKQ